MFPHSEFAYNVITFGADASISSSMHVDNKKKDILHYFGASSYLFVNHTEIHKFKAKDSEIVTTSLYLGNISKGFSEDNMPIYL